MKTIWIGLFILSACLLAGCKSSHILTLGENSTIRYQQFDKNTGQTTLELVLVEESHQDYEDLYSEARDNANIKKAPADMFNDLLKTFEDLGYLEMAKPRQLDSDPRREGASKALIVESDSGRWVCMNSRNYLGDETCDELDEGLVNDFHQMERMFLNYFDGILSLQVITNKEGGNLFYEEQKRLQKERQRKQQAIENMRSPK
jgi:hypothetical protein